MIQANIPSETRKQNDSGQPRNVRGKREDTSSLLPEGEAEEKERKMSYRCRAERSFQKDMLRDYTHIDIIRYVQSCDSLQAERQKIEKVRSSAERDTILGEVSMLAAQRNFTESSRLRSHVKARATALIYKLSYTSDTKANYRSYTYCIYVYIYV